MSDLQKPKTYLDRQRAGNAKYLLVSYAHDSSQEVYPILNALYDLGLNFWYDKELVYGKEWNKQVEKRIRDDACCGSLFFLDQNCLITWYEDGTAVKKNAVEEEIRLFDKINADKGNSMLSIPIIREKDESIYSLIRNVFVACKDYNDAKLQAVFPQKLVETLFKAFSSKTNYFIRENTEKYGDLIEKIRKQYPDAVCDSRADVDKFKQMFPKWEQGRDGIEVCFGSYPQDYYGRASYFSDGRQETDGQIVEVKDGKMYTVRPLEWVLLETDGVNATLVCKQNIDFCLGTQDEIDKWIEQFKNNAFSNKEKEILENVTLPSESMIRARDALFCDVQRTEFSSRTYSMGTTSYRVIEPYFWLEDCDINKRKTVIKKATINCDYIQTQHCVVPVVTIKMK